MQKTLRYSEYQLNQVWAVRYTEASGRGPNCNNGPPKSYQGADILPAVSSTTDYGTIQRYDDVTRGGAYSKDTLVHQNPVRHLCVRRGVYHSCTWQSQNSNLYTLTLQVSCDSMLTKYRRMHDFPDSKQKRQFVEIYRVKLGGR